MLFRTTIGLIALCSSAVALPQSEKGGQTCLDALEICGTGEAILGAIGFSGAPTPGRWLFLVKSTNGKLREKAISDGAVVAVRDIEPLPGQDLPDIPIDFAAVAIDSGEAFNIVAGLAEDRSVDFESAHFHLRCRESGNEPVWLLKLLGPRQDSRGVVYLSAATGEILRSAWTIREIEDFASATPFFTRTAP